MNDRWTSMVSHLPMPLRAALALTTASFHSTVREIRLRSGAPMILTAANDMVELPVTVTKEHIQDVFWRLCGQAVHTHAEELRYGFITTKDGLRVGVSGTAVMKDGIISTYRDITSLCIRVPREIHGCAAPLLPFIRNRDGLHGVLLCGAPGSGKTTLLRDLAQTLAYDYAVAVVDERSELDAPSLCRCDVIKGCPKDIGILQAVRTLSPDVILADELGAASEWEAVSHSLFCGVPLLASAHVGKEQQARARTELMRVLKNDGFEYIVFLPSKNDANEPSCVWKARDFIEDRRDRIDRVHLCGNGDHSCDCAREKKGVMASVDCTA